MTPSIYTDDHSGCIVCSFMENVLVLEGLAILGFTVYILDFLARIQEVFSEGSNFDGPVLFLMSGSKYHLTRAIFNNAKMEIIKSKRQNGYNQE